MPYRKKIVCLANSFKITGRCVAGREILEGGKYGGWIRPVSKRPTSELQLWECIYPDNDQPRLLDIMEIPLLGPAPRNHQTENHVIDNSREWIKSGELPWTALPVLEDRPPSLWVNSDRTTTGCFNCVSQGEAAAEHHSLVLIKTRTLAIQITAKPGDGKSYRNHQANFQYNGTRYSLKLTDPAAIEAFQRRPSGTYTLQNAYLSVSLTEPYDKDNNRCHKIVAAVFTSPAL
ncbi:MAG: hypothetical protein ABSG16_11405 [Candidatus Acidiferrum sp.]